MDDFQGWWPKMFGPVWCTFIPWLRLLLWKTHFAMAPQVLQQQVRRSHPGLCSDHRWGGAKGASLGPAEASEAGGFFWGPCGHITSYMMLHGLCMGYRIYRMLVPPIYYKVVPPQRIVKLTYRTINRWTVGFWRRSTQWSPRWGIILLGLSQWSQIAIENGHRKFVDLPIKHGDFP